MATIGKHKSGYRAQVYVHGNRKSKVFEKRADAKHWAARMEIELRRQVEAKDEVQSVYFLELTEKYYSRVSIHKKSEQWEMKKLKQFNKQFALLDHHLIPVHELKSHHISEWKHWRLEQVQGSTVKREFNLLAHVFKFGIERNYLTKNPCDGVQRPKDNPHRDRLPTKAEIDRIAFVVDWDMQSPPRTFQQKALLCFLIGCETALRASEMASLGPADFAGRVATLRDSKNSDKRLVPLTKRALELFELVDCCLDITPEQIDSNWRQIRDKAAVVDLTFHDSRHAGITTLSRKVDVLALARIVGHRDIRQLMTYYNESAEDIASRL